MRARLGGRSLITMNKIISTTHEHPELRFDENIQKLIDEAKDVLERVPVHQGEFTYSSTAGKTPSLCKLDIRPMKDKEANCGQPACHQYAKFFLTSVAFPDILVIQFNLE